MAVVLKPARNPIVKAAFAGLRKEQRAEKKATEPPPAPAKKKPAAKKGAKA